jgi:hypothetical protein
VGPEVGVLGGDEGVDQDRRHLVEADQGAALVVVDLADAIAVASTIAVTCAGGSRRLGDGRQVAE